MIQIRVATDFSRFPAGRYRKDAKHSGQAFREELLVPALRSKNPVTVILDGAMGYGSSFLEEAFGGLVRSGEFPSARRHILTIISEEDPSLRIEIEQYLDDAWARLETREAVV